ncbi:MAG: winged helix-turn-helix domain-containing protein [Marinicella sp.]
MNRLFKKKRQIFHFKPFVFDRQMMKLTKNGNEVSVGKLPLKLLELLITDQSRAFTRDQIKQELWPNSEMIDTNRRLNTVVRALRQVLDEDAGEPQYIETVRHIGYRWLAKSKLQLNYVLKPILTSVLSVSAVLISTMYIVYSKDTEPSITNEKVKIIVSPNTDFSTMASVVNDVLSEYANSDYQFKIRAEFMDEKTSNQTIQFESD